MAASAGIGLVTSALSHMLSEAERVGQKADGLQKFTDISGLTAEQIRGLGKVGKEFNVSSEEMTTAIQRFTVNLSEARRGAGNLYEEIRRIDPVLADQLASAKSAAEGIDIYAKALRRADEAGDAVQRSALSRAGLGKGGLGVGAALSNVAELGGLEAIANKTREVSGITNEWVENVARLANENERLTKQIADMKANAYAQEVLERQNQFLKMQKQITEELLKAGGGFAGMMAMGGDADFAVLSERRKASSMATDLGAGDIAGSVARSAKDAIDPLTELRNQLDLTIANASKAQAALGGLADAVDTLRTRQQALTAAFLGGTISPEQYTRANDAIQQQITYTEQLREKWGGVSTETAKQLESLSQQTALAQARTGIEQINLQYQQTIANAMGTQRTHAEAVLIAEAQRALAIAQVNAGLDQQLKSLQEQAEVLRGATELDRARVKAAQDYQKAVDAGGDSVKAAAVATQQIANARTQDIARETAEADRDAADAAQRKANDNQRAAAAAQREAVAAAEMARRYEQAYQAHKFLPFNLLDEMGALGGGFTSNQGGQSQFNPAGYTSTTTQSSGANMIGRNLYGVGGYDIQLRNGFATAVPNAQGQEKLYNDALAASGGNYASVAQGILGTGDISRGDMGQVSLLNRTLELLPKDQQILGLGMEIQQLQRAPASLQTSELIKQLNEKLQGLTQATDENTASQEKITDVLSPFYSSDPRRTHLGFRAFAGGGIMTEHGELPLRQYQGGGIATTPQVAVFGEGSTPEAYVPAPAGRIPGEIKMPANSNRPISVTINVQGNADASTVAALKTTAFQQAQAMRRMTG